MFILLHDAEENDELIILALSSVKKITPRHKGGCSIELNDDNTYRYHVSEEIAIISAVLGVKGLLISR